MKYRDYKNKREELVLETEKEIKKNNTMKANSLIKEIELLDKSMEDVINFAKEEVEKEILAKELANSRALNGEGNNHIPKFILNGIENRGDERVNGIFLNKNEKLADKVKNTDETTQNILKSDGALASVVRGMVTGKWDSDELKNSVTTTISGVLIPEYLSAKVIDLARNISLFGSSGVPIIPMNSNNLTISRVKNDPVFSFKKEGQEATESSFELDSIKLNSKTAYGYAYVTLEAIKSSQNLETILYDVFSKAMAQCIDNGFLYGQEGDTEDIAPNGIMNDEEVNKITATPNGGYDDIIRGVSKVKSSNGVPTALGINSQTEEMFSLLKTSDGQYLNPPKAVEELNQFVSNQLNYDASSGSDALVFDPNALIIGIQNNIQIKIIEDNECLKKGLVGFQIYSMLDCKATTPKNICKIIGIK